MQDNQRKYLSLFIKLLIAILLIYIVYRQLFIFHDFSDLFLRFKTQWTGSNSWFLIACIILMFPNWLLETIRWRKLVNQHFAISFKKSLQAVLMGVTLGMISPQRVGEYAGRLLAVPSDKNWLSVKANFLTSLSLNISILIFGIVAVLLFAENEKLFFDLSVNSILLTGTISLALLLLLFFNLKLIERMFNVEKYLAKLKNWGSFNAYQFSKRSLIYLLILSTLRYIVFLSQYALLLFYFGVDIDVWSLYACVAVIYLIQSSIPLPGMISLLARGEIALLVFSSFNVNEISILATTFSLWIINLLLPALCGLILLWKTSLFETIGFGKKT